MCVCVHAARRRKRHVMTEWQKDVMERWRREHEAEARSLLQPRIHRDRMTDMRADLYSTAGCTRTAHMSLRQVRCCIAHHAQDSASDSQVFVSAGREAL